MNNTYDDAINATIDNPYYSTVKSKEKDTIAMEHMELNAILTVIQSYYQCMLFLTSRKKSIASTT